MEEEIGVKKLKQDEDSDDKESENVKNKYSNDGSFLELFQSKMKEKKQEQSSHEQQTQSSAIQHNVKSIQV